MKGGRLKKKAAFQCIVCGKYFSGRVAVKRGECTCGGDLFAALKPVRKKA